MMYLTGLRIVNIDIEITCIHQCVPNSIRHILFIQDAYNVNTFETSTCYRHKTDYVIAKNGLTTENVLQSHRTQGNYQDQQL